MALSAWKQHRGDRWSLRVNLSSGDLHPTKGDTLRKRRREDRPEPRHKLLRRRRLGAKRADLTHPIDGQEVRGKELTFRWLVEEVAQRMQPEQPLIFLSDGDAALHRMQQDRLPGAVCILDIYHATERLWAAAPCFHPEGSQEANDFVVQRLERILEGEVGRVVGGMRQMATKQGLRGSRLAKLNEAAGYLSNQRAIASACGNSRRTCRRCGIPRRPNPQTEQGLCGS